MNRDDDGVRELKRYVEVAPPDKDLDFAGEKMIEEPRRARETFAPAFSFTSKEGEFITLEDLKGKTVVLDFWGTWCKPCLMATPGLLRLHKKYAEQDVVFIGVAVNDQEDAWAAYIEKNKMDWPQFLDKTRKIVDAVRRHLATPPTSSSTAKGSCARARAATARRRPRAGSTTRSSEPSRRKRSRDA